MYINGLFFGDVIFNHLPWFNRSETTLKPVASFNVILIFANGATIGCCQQLYYSVIYLPSTKISLKEVQLCVNLCYSIMCNTLLFIQN